MEKLTENIDTILKALAYCTVTSSGAFAEKCNNLHSEMLESHWVKLGSVVPSETVSHDVRVR